MLPHRFQDDYTRTRVPREFAGIVLENEHLRALVCPELGGRMLSLIDKDHGLELLHPVTFFQPANLANRNAWFAGGVEWNAGFFGHHYLTCSPIWAARVTSPTGYPVLRLYAWERSKCFTYQIDMHLPPSSRFLFVHVTLVNPHDYEIPMYWWTNIGILQSTDRRVVVPADSALHNHRQDGLALTEISEVEGVDATYVTNFKRSKECYFRIDQGQRRWITCLDGQGRGLVHASTARLCGRKMFAWGTSTGGMRWQEHTLDAGNTYLEIQAGLARTQIESVPMPAGARWEWTEAFGLLEADPR